MSGRRKHGTIALILIAAALVLLTNIPLLYGYLNSHPGLKFMGVVAGVRDANYYFMLMIQAEGWHPVLKNYFAAGEPDAVYHGFFWFLLGKLSHTLNISVLLAYHGARVLATAMLVPVSYCFLARFTKSKNERLATLVMLCFGAGAGWVQMIRYRQTGSLGLVPADTGTPEASTFFTTMTFPHLSFALILIVLCSWLLMKAISERKTWPATLAGLCGLLLGFIHAVNLIIIYAAFAAFALASVVCKKHISAIRPVKIFGVVSIWSIVYYVYLTVTNPQLLPQAPVRSPAPLSYVVGFAPFLALGGLHCVKLLKNRTLPYEDLFLICWVITNSLMLYSHPLISQEARAVLGLQAPLVVLSGRAIFGAILPYMGLAGQADRTPKPIAAAVVTGLIICFTFPSTFYNIFERVSRLRSSPETFSLTEDEYAALEFLRNEQSTEVVLSADWIGNYVPRVARKYSWLGQYDLPSHDSRLALASKFFAEATLESERYDLLKRHKIRFIFHGVDERKLGKFDPDRSTFLTRIFQKGSVNIYRFETKQNKGMPTP
ncbi:MAG: hypothetical protein HY801_04725 [Candidatus Lindowbacteria bacterium]|nr:hypothetical protein [Candidatus Lindowbacteria bacterium]